MNIHSIVGAMFTAGGGGKGKVQDIPPKEAHRKAVAGEVLIVDVRRADEWAETGTAPGAARITLQDTDFLDQLASATGGNKNAPVAFICKGGVRSNSAADKAVAAGYTHVFNITGGMSLAGGWLEAGLPVGQA